jgi:hypothetical protein
MGSLLSPSQECHPFYPSSLSHDLVVRTLPDLVIPIDGTYTMTYFYLTNKPLPDIESEVRTFKDIFMRAFKIVRKLNLKPEDVNKEGWNTSVPKLIDNAIIGLFKHLEKGEAEI